MVLLLHKPRRAPAKGTRGVSDCVVEVLLSPKAFLVTH